MHIAIVVGTRPEIIKMSPIIKACQERGVDFTLIDTKQHYSDNMSDSFFRDLGLPEPHYVLNPKTESHGQQLGSMMVQFEDILSKGEKLDAVLVQGDTNSVLAGALMASRAQIPVGHVEAGLRSHDRTMPEEINRIMADHASDYLFATSSETEHNLLCEGIQPAKVWNTGNTIVDATLRGVELARKTLKRTTSKLPKHYALLTMHRPANVDEPQALKRILQGVESVMRTFKFETAFPIHPRTRKNIERFGLTLPKGVHLLEPQGYLAFLQLQAGSSLILTDSGGIQEEACILHVPCVTLRENTERPETVEVGANAIGGTSPAGILRAAEHMLQQSRFWTIPYGDGHTAEHILDILQGKNRMPALSFSPTAVPALATIN